MAPRRSRILPTPARPALPRGGPRRLERDPAALAEVAGDASGTRGVAQARFRPTHEGEVVALVRWARRHRVPLVARGAGTSLDGESVPVRGGVVVDFSRMARIREVNEEDLWVRVEPGVVNGQLQLHLRRLGLFYPPNPGSFERCTIGGNAGTNASGFLSFRYGATRAWVLGARAVLGTGEVVEAGALTWKRSAGVELLPSLIGSEGTLALFTELTLRVAPLPTHRIGIAAPVPPGVSTGRIAQALQSTRREGLSAVEWVDEHVAGALSEAGVLPWEQGQGALLLELECPPGDLRSLEGSWARRLHALGLPRVLRTFPDSEELWRERGRTGSVMDARVGPRVREDVAVPISRWDELIAKVKALARRHGVELWLYAHLGEGSLHPNFLVPPDSPQAARLRRGLREIAWSLEGTASAEHGLGSLKREAYRGEHGTAAWRAALALKRELDPAGILNPGKFLE